MPSKSRRDVLAILTTAVPTTLSGCSLFSERDGTIPAGSLVLENDQEETHTVHVTITKTSHNPDESRPGTQTPSPETTPVSQTEQTFKLRPRKVKKGFINEPGAYYIQVRLAEPTERDKGGRVWAEFYAEDDGISGGYIQIWVQSNGYVTVSHIMQ